MLRPPLFLVPASYLPHPPPSRTPLAQKSKKDKKEKKSKRERETREDDDAKPMQYSKFMKGAYDSSSDEEGVVIRKPTRSFSPSPNPPHVQSLLPFLPLFCPPLPALRPPLPPHCLPLHCATVSHNHTSLHSFDDM